MNTARMLGAWFQATIEKLRPVKAAVMSSEQSAIAELFADLNGGLVHLKTEHAELAANVIRVDGTPGPDVHCLNEARADFALLTLEGRAYFEVLDAAPWDKDIRSELARNDNCPGSLKDGWWQRRLGQITGLTFHHTLSDSPYAFASRYVNKDGGRPSTCYSIWITQTGEVLLCNALTEGNWHDHTGHKCQNLCVGLAGRLHEYRPADVQLRAAAKVVKWAVEHPEMNIMPETVRGHMDVGTYAGKTQCPGWASAASGHWKPKLYEMIEALL